MLKEYRYKFQVGNKKHNCPKCGNKTFVKYIDSRNGEYLPERYGRCDREINCAYHLNPYRDQYTNFSNLDWKGEFSSNKKNIKIYKIKTEPIFIPKEILKQTLKTDAYQENIFIQNLLNRVRFPFEKEYIEKVISLYSLGTVTNGYMKGAITFPFIDKNENIRAIQVKQFDNNNHTLRTDFLHSIIDKHYKKKNEDFPNWLKSYKLNDKIVSCLFGEHLLNKYSNNPIALVEAPKTAIYGALYFGFPENPKNPLWLAVYNLSSLNYEKCKTLKCRKVYLFPDLSAKGQAFHLWSKKAKELSQMMIGTNFEVSNLLEKNATENERLNGLDLADFLINFDWRKFRTNL